MAATDAFAASRGAMGSLMDENQRLRDEITGLRTARGAAEVTEYALRHQQRVARVLADAHGAENMSVPSMATFQAAVAAAAACEAELAKSVHHAHSRLASAMSTMLQQDHAQLRQLYNACALHQSLSAWAHRLDQQRVLGAVADVSERSRAREDAVQASANTLVEALKRQVLESSTAKLEATNELASARAAAAGHQERVVQLERMSADLTAACQRHQETIARLHADMASLRAIAASHTEPTSVSSDPAPGTKAAGKRRRTPAPRKEPAPSAAPVSDVAAAAAPETVLPAAEGGPTELAGGTEPASAKPQKKPRKARKAAAAPATETTATVTSAVVPVQSSELAVPAAANNAPVNAPAAPEHDTSVVVKRRRIKRTVVVSPPSPAAAAVTSTEPQLSDPASIRETEVEPGPAPVPAIVVRTLVPLTEPEDANEATDGAKGISHATTARALISNFRALPPAPPPGISAPAASLAARGFLMPKLIRR